MRDDFAVFILTNKRADNVYTKKALEASNYTGKIYYIVDDEDPSMNDYIKNFGKQNVIIFNKESYLDKVDTLDNFRKKTAILYARHACYDIAKDLGLKYFMQADDDYTGFAHRYIDENNVFTGKTVNNADRLFERTIQFMEESKALTVAYCQGGDFIGGANSNFTKGLLRKAMNTFIIRTDNPIDFRGTLNDDVTTYATLGNRGSLFFSISSIAINQKQTQSVSGGMTDVYQDGGTYLKSFYSVISSPNCVKVAMLNATNRRIHHRVAWNNTVPCIVDEKHRKRSANV